MKSRKVEATIRSEYYVMMNCTKRGFNWLKVTESLICETTIRCMQFISVRLRVKDMQLRKYEICQVSCRVEIWFL